MDLEAYSPPSAWYSVARLGCWYPIETYCGGNYSEKQTNQVHSAKFAKAGTVTSSVVTSLLHMITRVTYEKRATRFPDEVVVWILRVSLVPGKTLPSR